MTPKSFPLINFEYLIRTAAGVSVIILTHQIRLCLETRQVFRLLSPSAPEEWFEKELIHKYGHLFVD